MTDTQAVPVGRALLPLRLFLGVTMVYAACLKLFDPAFLDPNAPNGVRQQMLRTAAASPISGLVTFSASHYVLSGLTIAFGELAVGLGLLLGLFTRLAGLGGVLLSLSFFLTVSWTTRPYFFGPDIGFAFAFTPFVIAGDGGVLSWQARLRRSVRQEMHLPPQAPDAEPEQVTDEVDRRTLVRSGVAASAVGLLTLLAGGLGAFWRRSGYSPVAAQTPAPALTSTTATAATSPTASATAAARPTAKASATAQQPMPAGPPAGASRVVSASRVPVGSVYAFTNPKDGQPALLLQPRSGTYRAYSAVCTHQGCTVGFGGGQIACPCHGATYSPETGQVTGGPAPAPLARIPVAEHGGQVYVL